MLQPKALKHIPKPAQCCQKEKSGPSRMRKHASNFLESDKSQRESVPLAYMRSHLHLAKAENLKSHKRLMHGCVFCLANGSEDWSFVSFAIKLWITGSWCVQMCQGTSQQQSAPAYAVLFLVRLLKVIKTSFNISSVFHHLPLASFSLVLNN